MSKYKLIKEYPGSPKLGTIVNHYSNWGLYSINHHLTEIYTQSMVENYPEYWEKVVEKEYEILSYSFKNIIYNKQGNIYTDNKSYVLEGPKNTIIHSVKRLSDGEVFTIGDKVKCWDGDNEISEIFIYNNKLRFFMIFQTKNKSDKSSSYTLSAIKKCKEILFTTEDGVDIYQNSELWWVAVKEDTKILSQDKKWEYDRFDWNELRNPSSSKNYKWFSTREKAEEYILYNKPMLSLNEVFKNIEFQYRKDLIKLAKEKIKL